MREKISTDRAPAAIGPYSQALKVGPLVFLSGQIALDPKSGELVGGGAVPETRQVLENLTAVIGAAGGSLAEVVKTTIYLTDLGDFATVNKIYEEVFGESKPARATVGVAQLPKGGCVEIDAIVVMKEEEG